MANEMQVFYFHRGSFAAEIFYLNGGLGRRSQQNFMLLRWSMKQSNRPQPIPVLHGISHFRLKPSDKVNFVSMAGNNHATSQRIKQ